MLLQLQQQQLLLWMSVAILAMPSVRLSTIVCSDDDADEDQDETMQQQQLATSNGFGIGNAHVDGSPTCAQVDSHKIQLSVLWTPGQPGSL
ncbi:hypothetical protein ACLKA7_013956 [Drosophila subpalustris]